MNRNNKILVGVLAMTIGYEIFLDKITITSIVKTKGYFLFTTT